MTTVAGHTPFSESGASAAACVRTDWPPGGAEDSLEQAVPASATAATTAVRPADLTDMTRRIALPFSRCNRPSGTVGRGLVGLRHGGFARSVERGAECHHCHSW